MYLLLQDGSKVKRSLARRCACPLRHRKKWYFHQQIQHQWLLFSRDSKTSHQSWSKGGIGIATLNDNLPLATRSSIEGSAFVPIAGCTGKVGKYPYERRSPGQPAKEPPRHSANTKVLTFDSPTYRLLTWLTLKVPELHTYRCEQKPTWKTRKPSSQK